MKQIFLTLLSVALVWGKVYDRCELARELLTVHRAPFHQIPTWVCIAEHESTYRTHVVGNLSGDGSHDYGLFQINDRYWCSPPGEGQGCGLSCSKLQDDDISDDFQCVQKIYKEHKKLQGDGFRAWAVYQPHCQGPKAEKYVNNCFDDSVEPISFNEVQPDLSSDFFNASGRNENFAYSQNAFFDDFFTPKHSAPLSSSNYATTGKPSTVGSNKGSWTSNFNSLFFPNFAQSSRLASEDAAIKFTKPSTKFYYSRVETTDATPKFPYIDRLAFFNPTTSRPVPTVTTITTPSRFSTSSQFKPVPTVSTVTTPSTTSRFRSTVSSVRNPSIFSASQFRPVPTVSTVYTPSTYSPVQFKSTTSGFRNPSTFSVSQYRPVPTVSTENILSAFQTSKFGRIPSVNAARITSKNPTSHFRPSHLTSTSRPTARYTSSFQTSKSFFVPSPTAASFFGPSSTASTKTTALRPVFIINGAKWY